MTRAAAKAPVVVEDVPDLPKSGAELLQSIKPVKRRGHTYLCLRPDLLNEWEALTHELQMEAAQSTASNRLGGGGVAAKTPAMKAKAKRIVDLEKAIDAAQVKFVMESMPSPEFNRLKTENPPRDGVVIDTFFGYDKAAVSALSIRECIIDPIWEDCESVDHPERVCDHSDCGSWQQLVTLLNPSEWQELETLWASVNGAQVMPPFSELAHLILEPSRRPRSVRTGG